jgi:AraC family transcriptional regulator
MPIRLEPGKFYGTVSQKRDLRDFRLTETAYRPESRVPVHAHEHPYFCFVLAGSFEESSRGRIHEHALQDLIFHPASEVHADRFHRSGGRCFNLEMSAPFVERLRDEETLLSEPAKFRNGPASWLGMRLHKEFHRTDSAAPLAMEGLALELVSEFLRRAAAPQSNSPQWLVRVRDLLHARFSEPLTLSEIAQSVDIHPAYLARGFRRHLHTTVGSYVRKLRIEFASRQLTDGAIPLSEIAVAAGFADQSHFTRAFRNMTGLTPARYRSSRKQSQSQTIS